MHPVTGRPWPPMPDMLIAAWNDLAGFPAPSEACLINFYHPAAKMGLHQDRDEEDFDAPVVSQSLGDSCLFRVGGLKRSDPTTLPPGSLILMYWTGGAFLMAAKRLSEYREIVESHGKEVLAQYRASFAHYSETSLTISCFIYALFAIFFLAVFLIKYRIEYLVTVPVIIALFAYYMVIAIGPGSSAQKPERLFREPGLVFISFIADSNIPAHDLRRRPAARRFGGSTIYQHPMTLGRLLGPSHWDDIRLVAFDVDGTLYSQYRLRVRMTRDILLDAASRRALDTITILRT
jgi:hypothetical protein